jgi:hypothetical protein
MDHSQDVFKHAVSGNKRIFFMAVRGRGARLIELRKKGQKIRL